MKTTQLLGIHAVTEAQRAGRTLERVTIARGARNPRLKAITEECRQQKIPVRFEPREALDQLARCKLHQGVIAAVAVKPYRNLEDVIEELSYPGLIVVLDGVEDPHNLGAIIRSAHATGVNAVVIPSRRSTGITQTVARTAAGALEYVEVVRTPNTNRALTILKNKGYWLVGLDEKATENYDLVDYSRATVLVMGREGKGLHRLTTERCDTLVRIPVVGRIASLNVSVAAGVVLFETLRQRRKKKLAPQTAQQEL